MVVKKRDDKKKRKAKGWIFHWKNRIGLSTVVIALILVLIVLIAVFALWGPVKRLIQKQTEMAQIQNQFFSEQINIIDVNFNQQFVNVTVRKPSGQMKTSSVNITLSGGEQRLDSDIFSVVDLSGSMRECYGITRTKCNNMGGSWNSPVCSSLQFDDGASCISYGGTWSDRLTATQNANRDMINTILGLGNNRIGLVAYRDNVVDSGSVGLTNDANLLNATIDSWQATSMTCICCGINNASWSFSRQSTNEKLKSLIVMSDGEANVECSQQGTGDAKQDAIKAACDANSSLRNLVIYSIGVEGADQETLVSIANCGAGQYFPVANASGLIETYQAIAQSIQNKFESLTALAFLYVVFFNGTDALWEKVIDIPGVLETKTYNFNLQGKLSGTITKIELYPVVLDSSKREVIGPLLDSWGKR